MRGLSKYRSSVVRRRLKRFIRDVSIGAAVYLAVALSFASVAAAKDSSAPGLIVKWRRAGKGARFQALGAGVSSVKAMRSDGRFELVTADSEADLDSLRAKYAADPDVEYLETNHAFKALFTPNDTLYDLQWNLGQIRAPAAWGKASGGGAGVTVAVLDTGIAYEDYGIYRKLPDFAGTAFVPGYDFVNGDPHPNDDQGHGSHVAGVIAATTNNGYGTAGIAFGVRLMPVKVLNQYGDGDTFEIADGIRWAADNGAKVINLSLGSPSPAQTVADAVNYAKSKKVTVVAAAGNGAEVAGYTGGMFYPATYPSVIAVGATRYSKSRASYSQYGAGLDIVAPGGQMSLDQNGDGHPDGIIGETIQLSPYDPARAQFYWAEGTSVAAPQVSAAAALLIARGVTDPNGVYEALTRSAGDIGEPGYDTGTGYGLLDIAAALEHRPTATKWYFAEGSTAKGFNTRIFVGNATSRLAKLRVTFSKPDGAKVIKRYNVRAESRFTVDVAGIGGFASTGLSAKVESINGVPIVVERAMVFNYRHRTGGHVTLGTTTPAVTWFLPEGKTTNGFETQVIVYNPSTAAAVFRATFAKANGSLIARDYAVPAWGRRKIFVDKVPGMEAAAFSTTVRSLNGVGIVAERSMYFDYLGRDGGHNVVGARAASTRWLFAEGRTGPKVAMKLIVQNPSSSSAAIKAEFFRPGAGRVTRRFTIGAGRRLTINVNKVPGLRATEVSTRIRSTNGIGVVAERTMYFDFGRRNDGSATMGAKKPAAKWYLADGATGDKSDSWILMFNPGSRTAAVTARFMKPDGGVVSQTLNVPGHSRRSLYLDSIPGLENTEIAAVVTSSKKTPIIVESSTYFDRPRYSGGDVAGGYAP